MYKELSSTILYSFLKIGYEKLTKFKITINLNIVKKTYEPEKLHLGVKKLNRTILVCDILKSPR